MRQTRISTYIDLLFCLVILPLIIMLVPVEKWIIHHTYFMLTLIVYLYALYFTYRKANIPSLFLRHKFGQVFHYNSDEYSAIYIGRCTVFKSVFHECNKDHRGNWSLVIVGLCFERYVGMFI